MFAIVSCFLNASAFILMKMAHIKIGKSKSNKSAFLEPIWVIGWISSLLAVVFDVMAISYGN